MFSCSNRFIRYLYISVCVLCRAAEMCPFASLFLEPAISNGEELYFQSSEWLWDRSAEAALQKKGKRRRSVEAVDSEIEITEAVARKKLFHNANERERRKQMNALFCRLLSLLPSASFNGGNSSSAGNSKQVKLNNPDIVNRVINYIPQVQQEISLLRNQRDQLLDVQSISNRAATGTSIPSKGFLSTAPLAPAQPNLSLLIMGKEIVITFQASTSCRNLISLLLMLLEEDGLELMTASLSVAQDTAWHSLHFRVMEGSGCFRIDAGALRFKLLNILWQKSEELAPLERSQAHFPVLCPDFWMASQNFTVDPMAW